MHRTQIARRRVAALSAVRVATATATCGTPSAASAATASAAASLLTTSSSTAARYVTSPNFDMHPRRGLDDDDHQDDGTTKAQGAQVTWQQHEAKMRVHRRRMTTQDTTSKMLYEYHMLKRICQKRPLRRQWMVRDDFCNMDAGCVEMSPSMQSAFMRVLHSKPKGQVRQSLREIVPIILYRNTDKRQALLPRDNPEAFIPKDEPENLNQKKREMFERQEQLGQYDEARLVDERAQAKLRFKIRMRLIRFQRKIAHANVAASRSILYSEADAIGYFLFRAPAMYAAVHRVLYELTKRMPWFVPKSMLDFGTGTGTAILAAKEAFDPDGLSMPLYRDTRRGSNYSDATAESRLRELRTDLKRLTKTNEAKRRARFMAVAALIEKGELRLQDLPKDLRAEVQAVARRAAAMAEERKRAESFARLNEALGSTGDGSGEWSGDAEVRAKRLMEESEAAAAYERDPAAATGPADDDAEASQGGGKTWWEQYVDDEASSTAEAVKRRLQPLQRVVAVEPSPGMTETAMNVLQNDVPNLTWQRYLDPEDAEQHDLVVAAYSLSELATPEERRRTIQDLWRRTSGVLVLIEHANLPNFNLLMEARDCILEHKGVGLWDWQPTIVGPCPHEARCPIRHSAIGVKRRHMRVCKTSVDYKVTFVERWVMQLPRQAAAKENISYLIIARNEMVPERAVRRRLAVAEQERQEREARDRKHKEMFEAALRNKDALYERLSEEALDRPIGGDMSTAAASNVSTAPSLGALEPSTLTSPADVAQLSVGAATGQLAAPTGGDALITGATPSIAGAASSAGPSQQQLQPSDMAAAALMDAALDANSGSLAVGGADSDVADPVGLLTLRDLSNPAPTPKVVNLGNGRYHRLTYPLMLPPASHRYNRTPYFNTAHQLQRVISPAEVLVVRREMQRVREYYTQRSNSYWRIVMNPPYVKGKITANFCTPEGDLVRGRVYRRFLRSKHTLAAAQAALRRSDPKLKLYDTERHNGDAASGTAHAADPGAFASTMANGSADRWQYIGGWRYLKTAREGSLFPSDVPVFGIRKLAQIDMPNTMMGKRLSAVEATAMQHGAPLDVKDSIDATTAASTFTDGSGSGAAAGMKRATTTAGGGRMTANADPSHRMAAAIRSGIQGKTAAEVAGSSFRDTDAIPAESPLLKTRSPFADATGGATAEPDQGAMDAEADFTENLLGRRARQEEFGGSGRDEVITPGMREAVSFATSAMGRGQIDVASQVDGASPVASIEWSRVLRKARRRMAISVGTKNRNKRRGRPQS